MLPIIVGGGDSKKLFKVKLILNLIDQWSLESSISKRFSVIEYRSKITEYLANLLRDGFVS